MREIIYDDGDLTVFNEGSVFLVRYDAGSHQIVMREDEITEKEALQIMKGPAEAAQVLFALQKRLSQMGSNPYKSNVSF
jgi:hypothetical protein